MPPVFGVLFDGLAYGMLLFLLSVGLSVTLGMMNFVNLAHCSFAMLGGYVAVTLTHPAHRVADRSRSGPVAHRLRIRPGRGRGLYLRNHPAAGAPAVLSARQRV